MIKNTLNVRLIVLYAVIAGFLMSLTPLALVLTPHHEYELQPAAMWSPFLDVAVLFGLNVCVFFVSLLLNVSILDQTKIRKAGINLSVYLMVTLIAIVIHKPVWMTREILPLEFFIRDEFVRNLMIFSISYIIAMAYDNFFQNQRMKNRMLEIEHENLTGQIESLKQQINPHFFFNSLNTLSGLIQEDSGKTVEFIEKLSQIFRYVLDIQAKNMVTIAEELNFAEAYIYLLKVRFEDKFSVEIEIHNTENENVPSLCSQLLLENCFKHNSMSKNQPLKIKIQSEPGYLTFSNSISQLKNVDSTRLGLNNLNERSKLLTGKPIEIKTINDWFIVKVPKIII